MADKLIKTAGGKKKIKKIIFGTTLKRYKV